MAGAWFATFARRIIHAETFEFVVAPAIADLQVEASGAGYLVKTRGYLGVWMALWGALCSDVVGDARVVGADTGILAGLAFMQTSYYAGMLMLALESLTIREALVILLGLLAVSLIVTLLCFWPARRLRALDA